MLSASTESLRPNRTVGWRGLPVLLAVVALPLAARAVSGSDDNYGWRDVDDADGPPYSHVDLSSTGGTDLGLGTGDSATLTLPFTFPFYGTDWTEITVHSTGVVSMGSGSNDPGGFAAAGGCVADGTVSDAFVAPLWDDWDLDLGGAVYYQTWTDSIFVQWADIYRDSATTSSQDFGVWLHANGEIHIMFDDLWGGTSDLSYGRLGATGVQDGSEGVSLACGAGQFSTADDGVALTPLGMRHLQGAMPVDDWADAFLNGDGASDRFGWSVDITPDLTGDGVDDLLVGAPYDDDGASNAGTVWLFAGGEDLAGDLGSADATVSFTGDASGDQLGASVHGGGDLDGDGLDDVIVGIPYGEYSSRDEGLVALYLGASLSGALTPSDADALFWGEASGDTAGTSVVILGDSDGDGFDDLAIGAPTSDLGGSDSGSVYVLLGGLTWLDTVLSSADAVLEGVNAGDAAGYRVAAAGDVDADGQDDLLAGAYGVDDAGAGAGAAYVVAGADIGTGSSALDSHYELLGGSAGDSVGLGVASAGDMSGLGLDGIFVGAYGAGASSQGAVYYQDGPPSSYPAGTTSADLTISGSDADRLGYAMAAIDLDGAGQPSLAVGAYGNYDGATGGGSVYMFHGDDITAGSVSDTTGAWGQLIGAESSGYLGASVDAGDLNGDGYDDLVAGAWGAAGDASSSGRVYVVLGRPSYPDLDEDGFMGTEWGGPDCDDSDNTVGPAESESCDGLDNDCDGSVDEDWGDSDSDGVADCLDSEECDGVDNDGDGDVDEGMTDTDGDGTCDGLDEEDCDGVDNDGDGDVDGEDAECSSGFDGAEANGDPDDCADGEDSDGDGWVDRNDPDCLVAPYDETGLGADVCSDGIDNDGDGLADGADAGCSSASDDDEGADTCSSIGLDAAGSWDPDDDAMNTYWYFAFQPIDSELVSDDILGGSTPIASFTPDRAGTWTVGVIVSDGQFNSLPDFITMQIDLAPGPCP